jgi:hypothetical protein
LIDGDATEGLSGIWGNGDREVVDCAPDPHLVKGGHDIGEAGRSPKKGRFLGDQGQWGDDASTQSQED